MNQSNLSSLRKNRERECRISTDSSRSDKFRWQTQPLTTQGTDRYRKETQGTEVGTQVLAKAAVRTTWVESPVTYPSDLHLGQLRLEDMKVGESQVPKTSMYLDQSISRIR